MTIIVAISPEIETLIKKYSDEYALDPCLVAAFCMQESGFEPWRARFEPLWNYLYFPMNYSHKLYITFDTEQNFQKTSWGLMQVMGSVARELGYDDHLQKLSLPEFGLLFGCKKLASLKMRYTEDRDIISAYNQGSPIKGSEGKYKNQEYVDRVLTARAQYAFLR